MQIDFLLPLISSGWASAVEATPSANRFELLVRLRLGIATYLFEIVAGREVRIDCGEDDHFDVVVLRCMIERSVDIVDQLIILRVPLIRSVEDDPGDIWRRLLVNHRRKMRQLSSFVGHEQILFSHLEASTEPLHSSKRDCPPYAGDRK